MAVIRNLYPLTAEDIAQAVKNAGYMEYTARDFCHNLECEHVQVLTDGVSACYSYTYFDDNEGRLEVGRVHVQVDREGRLVADW